MNLHHEQEFFRLMCGLLYAPLKTRFTMACFAKRDKPGGSARISPYTMRDECGTAGCVLGHAPLFCITEKRKFMYWYDYARAAFGIRTAMDPMFDFVFDVEWPDDKEQAAARIFHGFHKGWPDKSTYYNYTGTFDVPTEQQVAALSKKLGVPIVREVVAV